MSNEEEYMTQQEVDEELHECARHGELDLLKEMKESDDTNMLNFNVLDAAGNCVIHKAAANGHIDMLDYLKANGAKYFRNHAGLDPLIWAIRNKETAAVKWLIANYSGDIDVLFKPNEFAMSALSTAHDVGEVDIIEILFEHPSSKALDDKSLDVDSDDDEDAEADEDEMNQPDTQKEEPQQQQEEGAEIVSTTPMTSDEAGEAALP